MQLDEALAIHFENLEFIFNKDSVNELYELFSSVYDKGMFDFPDIDFFLFSLTPYEFARMLSVQALKNVTLRDACAPLDSLSQREIDKIPYASAYYDIARMCLTLPIRVPEHSQNES